MKCIVGECSSGKTKKLLEYAKENGITVICRNPSAMTTKAQSYGIFGLNIIGYGDTKDVFEQNVVIDELNDFLNYHFEMNLCAFTATEE